jgi:hypothetical protein
MLTTEKESRQRKSVINNRGFLVALLIIVIGIIALIRYAVHDNRYYAYTKIVQEQIGNTPHTWLYLGAIDQSIPYRGGGWQNPVFAATKDNDGNYLVATMIMDAAFRHGDPDPNMTECLAIFVVPESMLQDLIDNPGSKAATKALSKLTKPCGTPLVNTWYDTRMPDLPTLTWNVGSIALRRTAETLINQ